MAWESFSCGPLDSLRVGAVFKYDDTGRPDHENEKLYPDDVLYRVVWLLQMHEDSLFACVQNLGTREHEVLEVSCKKVQYVWYETKIGRERREEMET